MKHSHKSTALDLGHKVQKKYDTERKVPGGKYRAESTGSSGQELYARKYRTGGT